MDEHILSGAKLNDYENQAILKHKGGTFNLHPVIHIIHQIVCKGLLLIYQSYLRNQSVAAKFYSPSKLGNFYIFCMKISIISVSIATCKLVGPILV